MLVSSFRDGEGGGGDIRKGWSLGWYRRCSNGLVVKICLLSFTQCNKSHQTQRIHYRE